MTDPQPRPEQLVLVQPPVTTEEETKGEMDVMTGGDVAETTETRTEASADERAGQVRNAEESQRPDTTRYETQTVPSQVESWEPPSKPPRPPSPTSSARQTLREAFPKVDDQVINAVLIASGGQLEPAFNGLLGMSDPEFQPEAPPRPTREHMQRQAQLEEDERMARQLAEEDNIQSGGMQAGTSRRNRQVPPLPNRRGDDEEDHSFFDDDLPVIRDNLTKGFNDTRVKVNTWIDNFRKRIDNEPISGSSGHQEREGFDADPTLITDDFSHLHTESPRRPLQQYNQQSPFGQQTGQRPMWPSRPTEATKRTVSTGSKKEVSFSPTAEEIPTNPLIGDEREASPSRKWEPLRHVEPAPDPFLVGDDDEEELPKPTPT